jgi:hypothetical protein
MPFPAGLPLVTLVCQFDTPPDGAAFGSVRITSPQPLQGPDDDSIVPVIDQVVRLDPATGSATFRLPPVTVDGWTPENWAYSVTAAVNGLTPIRGTVQLFVDDTTVNLADRLILTSSVIVPGVTYATLAQLNAGLATKSDIGHTHASGDHTHEIEDINDLQVQLDGKQPAGDYLVAADIDNLVSYETLTESLTDYLPKMSPVVTDSTFTVARSAGGAARWRSTGGAIDWEVVGDVIESRWSGAGFTGTQTDLRRLRADGNTLAGVTEFGPNAFGGQQRIDGRAGQHVAYLGAKNTATNLGIAGYLDITTAPTTGIWAVGDIVDTRVGRFRCTVAGEPGTWVWLQASTAVDHGFSGWMGDPADIQAGLIIASGGTPLIFRFRADQPTVSAMNIHVTSPGTLLTNAYWTLHNDAGDILGAGAKSADQSTNLQTGGERTMPLTVAQAVTPGAFYRARFWVTTSGGALPTVSRRCNSSNAAINAGGQLWYATAAGGLTTAAAAPDAIGTLLTTLVTAYWAGWKA